MAIIWNMKYNLRYKVQFLGVKFCFCLFCWHIISKLLSAVTVLRKSVHEKHFWRTVETFCSLTVETFFQTFYFLQWQCWENLSTKNIFEGTVTMTLKATFTLVRSIILAVIMIVLTEVSCRLLFLWWN